MTIHAFIQYLIYKRKSKGRHGVHSPFVYTFVEEALQDKNGTLAAKIDGADNYAQQGHYGQLVTRIKTLYNYQSLIKIPPQTDLKPAGPYDMLLFKSGDNPNWLADLEQYSYLAANEGMAILSGIHATALHTDQWRQCCDHSSVTLSIDLYGMGLLLFNKDFKVKQHFVLKY